MAGPFLAVALALALLPAAAAAQTPPPDERATAQAMADAAKRLVGGADALETSQDWTDECPPLMRDPPARRWSEADAYLEGLILRDYLGKLGPALARFRTEIANVHPADPALLSGRAAARRIARAVAAVPPGEPDPCAAYEAYAKAGYPEGPAREARALERRIGELATRGVERKIRAAAARMRELGVTRKDARGFVQLVS